MKLFVDDTRPYPKDCQCVGCAAYAKLLLEIMEFEFISLDYDLGKGEENGLDILVWMKENNISAPHINVHSNHIFGRQKMKEFCEANFPESKITANMLPK